MKVTNRTARIYLEKARRLFTHDWEAKLVALVLAFLVWYIIKDVVNKKPDFPENWNTHNQARV